MHLVSIPCINSIVRIIEFFFLQMHDTIQIVPSPSETNSHVDISEEMWSGPFSSFLDSFATPYILSCGDGVIYFYF